MKSKVDPEKASERSRWWCFEPDEIDYELLDPGIREVVRWLVACGYHTTDSGDGEFKRAHGWTEESGLVPHPHVMIQVEPDRIARMAAHLVRDLARIGIEVVSQTEAWSEVIEQTGNTIKPGDAVKPKPYIEVSYDPIDERAMMGLYYVTSDMVPAVQR